MLAMPGSNMSVAVPTGRCLQGDDMLKQLKFEDITVAGNVMYVSSPFKYCMV
jgi:hypothetical protein